MTAISSVCTTNLSNLGSGGCATANPFIDPIAIILTNSSFTFAAPSNFATQSDWIAGITAGTVFPLQGIVEYEDQSEETQYYESPTGNRVVRRLGKYRFTFRFNKPFAVHKKLQSFRNANVKMFIVDSEGNIWGTKPTGTVGTAAATGAVQGFTVSLFNPEKLSMPGADGTPAWSAVAVDLYDPQEWNEYGIYANPTWNPTDLEPLTDVILAQVGETSATEFKISVSYQDQYTSAGAVNNIGISGLVVADFAYTKSGSGAITSVTDNADGTYTFAGTAFAGTDTVTLVAPASLTDKTGLLIEAINTVTLTAIP